MAMGRQGQWNKVSFSEGELPRGEEVGWRMEELTLRGRGIFYKRVGAADKDHLWAR